MTVDQVAFEREFGALLPGLLRFATMLWRPRSSRGSAAGRGGLDARPVGPDRRAGPPAGGRTHTSVRRSQPA